MALLRATVTIPHISGLPRDSVTNSFYFGSPTTGPDSVGLDFLKADLLSFWNTVAPSDNLGKFLGTQVVGSNARLKVYNLATAAPRPPVYDVPFAISQPGGVNVLPSEVACVLSFQAAPLAGVPQARRRGRIFVGPLKSTVQDGVNVSPNFQAVATQAMQRLATLSGGAGHYPWVVQAGTDVNAQATTAPVQNGWVDNAFDTQRRRGERATGRVVWSV